jgi:hypothetical protein
VAEQAINLRSVPRPFLDLEETAHVGVVTTATITGSSSLSSPARVTAAGVARRDSAEAAGSFLATEARVIAERWQNAPAGNFADIALT